MTGLTVVELTIVIVIIGITFFLALPTFRDFVQYSWLQNDAWRILSDLRAYRQQAIIEHVDCVFQFNPTDDSYNVEKRDYLTGALLSSEKTVVLSNDLTEATDITFHPKGNATPEITLTVDSRHGDGRIVVTVQSSTGAVRTKIH